MEKPDDYFNEQRFPIMKQYGSKAEQQRIVDLVQKARRAGIHNAYPGLDREHPCVSLTLPDGEWAWPRTDQELSKIIAYLRKHDWL